MERLLKKVKIQLNLEYSDDDSEKQLEGNIAACSESLILGGITVDEFELEEISPIIIQTIVIMILDLSEETPGLMKLSPAANFFALQKQLGVDGNG